jgi:hypothetical protein
MNQCIFALHPLQAPPPPHDHLYSKILYVCQEFVNDTVYDGLQQLINLESIIQNACVSRAGTLEQGIIYVLT